MVDRALVASRIATVRDAAARVRAVLPGSIDELAADRTAREVVTLNLFVAIQACLDLATRWLADAGWDVPVAYGEVFASLRRHGVIAPALADRLSAAAGFRNVVAHQDRGLDWSRVHAIATSDLEDLEAFCAALAEQVTG